MEKMYINRGGVIIIGDTITGNHTSGVRYFDYSLREAIREYRRKFNLVGVHFKKVFCGVCQFGYLY